MLMFLSLMTNLDRIAATDYIPTYQDMQMIQKFGTSSECSIYVEGIIIR